jgi:hypothetical protein
MINRDSVIVFLIALACIAGLVLLGCGCTPEVGNGSTVTVVLDHPTFVFNVPPGMVVVQQGAIPVNAPITATANITVNGHVFSATAPATRPSGGKP